MIAERFLPLPAPKMRPMRSKYSSKVLVPDSNKAAKGLATATFLKPTCSKTLTFSGLVYTWLPVTPRR